MHSTRPSIVDLAMYSMVGPCEEGRSGSAAQGTALDYHPRAGRGRCGSEPSRIHNDKCPP